MSDAQTELMQKIPVHAMQFTQGDDDSFNRVIMCEITERTDDEIEFAFDLASPKRRTYIRFKVRDLVAELERTK